MKTTTGIPESILQVWALSPGWEQYAQVQIAHSEYLMGDGQHILAIRHPATDKWEFHAPLDWLSDAYRFIPYVNERPLVTLGITAFRAVLIAKCAGLEEMAL
ncbi:MAG: hypothetical protein ACFB2W_00910 [Leptolyngbyaceae cyanobacterium]